ncbi:YihY/virulence factor BrkB family protein [Burkholderia pseudomallei]
MKSLIPQQPQKLVRHNVNWALDAFKRFSADRCTAMAASIAFYSAFSLAPTLVMVIAVAGWFFGADAARGEVFSHVHELIGNEAAAGVQTIVENAHRSGSRGGTAALISFAMLALGASATFASLNTALSVIWPATGARASSVLGLVRIRLISFGLVLGVAFLLIVSLVLDTAITFIGRWLWGASPYVVIGNLLQFSIGIAVLAFAFGTLMKFLPDARVSNRDAMTGGIVSAVLFSAGKKLFALYLAHAGTASAFGAAGSFAVLLMWLYFSAAVLLLGAEFAAARGAARASGEAAQPGEAAPARRPAQLTRAIDAPASAPRLTPAFPGIAREQTSGSACRASSARTARARRRVKSRHPGANRSALRVTVHQQTFAGVVFVAETAQNREPPRPGHLLSQQSQRNNRPTFPESKQSFMWLI